MRYNTRLTQIEAQKANDRLITVTSLIIMVLWLYMMIGV
jgi:hypothetical protein